MSMRGNRQVQPDCRQMVGQVGRVQNLARHQSAAAGLYRRTRGFARQTGFRCRLWRRHPRGKHGAARRGVCQRYRHGGAVVETARLHAALNNVADIEYECVRVEDLAGATALVRCGNVHGNDGTRPRSRRHRACLCQAGQVGRHGVFPPSIKPEIVPASDCGGGISVEVCPQRHARLEKFISPAELARMCRQAGLDVADTKGMTYHVLSQTYALCDSTDVNYMFACRPAF